MIMRPLNGVRLGDTVVPTSDYDSLLVIPASVKDQIWEHYNSLPSDELCFMFEDVPVEDDVKERIVASIRQLSLFLSDCDFDGFDENDIGKMHGVFSKWKSILKDNRLEDLSFEDHILTTDNARNVYDATMSYVERFDQMRTELGLGLGSKK